jgi:hypothetical protein
MKLISKKILCLCVAGVINSSLAMLAVIEKDELEKAIDASVFSKTESLSVEEKFDKIIKTDIGKTGIIDQSLLSRAKEVVLAIGRLFLKDETPEELLERRMKVFLHGIECAPTIGIPPSRAARTLYSWDRNRTGCVRSVKGTLYFAACYAYCGDLQALGALSGSISEHAKSDLLETGDQLLKDAYLLRNEVFFLGRNGKVTWEEYQQALPEYEKKIAAIFGGMFPAPK